MSDLILPGDDEYDLTIGSIMPFNWRKVAYSSPEFVFIARAGSGLLEAVPSAQATEYLYGGEYDQRLSEFDGDPETEEEYILM